MQRLQGSRRGKTVATAEALGNVGQSSLFPDGRQAGTSAAKGRGIKGKGTWPLPSSLSTTASTPCRAPVPWSTATGMPPPPQQTVMTPAC